MENAPKQLARSALYLIPFSALFLGVCYLLYSTLAPESMTPSRVGFLGLMWPAAGWAWLVLKTHTIKGGAKAGWLAVGVAITLGELTFLSYALDKPLSRFVLGGVGSWLFALGLCAFLRLISRRRG